MSKQGFRLRMQRSLILLVCILLTGCAVMERNWLVPRSNASVPIPDNLGNSEVLSDFVEIAVSHMQWHKEPTVTFLDLTKGIVELGHWRKSNVSGYSARAVVREGCISFIVKGTGPYYTKLPVLEVSRKIRLELEDKMRQNINRSVLNIYKPDKYIPTVNALSISSHGHGLLFLQKNSCRTHDV